MKNKKLEVKNTVYYKEIPICSNCNEKAAVQLLDEHLDDNLCMHCLTSELYHIVNDPCPINMILKDRRILPR